MKRREFIILLGGAAVAPASWPHPLHADQRARRISILVGAGSDPEAQSWIKDFRQRLHDLGWEEGNNVKTDLRWGGADIDFIRASAAEFVSAKPDLIFVYSVRALNEIRQATRQIPVVFNWAWSRRSFLYVMQRASSRLSMHLLKARMAVSCCQQM